MKARVTYLILITLIFASCQSKYFTADDFQSVLKIDSHIHIGSDDGTFEDPAEKDNFLLMTLNVDHSDSANIRKQFNYAVQSAQKYPGRVFFGPTFLFDTIGWGTEEWSRKIIAQLEKDITEGASTVKIWKNIGMTVRDRNGKIYYG